MYSFYVLDEDGNPVPVEITQGDVENASQNTKVKLFSRARSGAEVRTNVIGVVRFKSSEAGVVKYTEVDTGRAGYFNCYSAADAAYIRTEDDGSVICKLAGVVMRVASGYIDKIQAYSDCGVNEVSHYYINNGYLIHRYTYSSGSSLSYMSTRVGYKPSYLVSEGRYYSYDGHYFYNDFAKMISDYRNNTYNNAVNANAPYYNYYQYLSFHATASLTAEQYDAHVEAQNKPTSVMLGKGKGFVDTENKYTINALLMYGIAINESGWGTNKYSTQRNNIFSINAPDSNPDLANSFESVEACINEFAYKYIHKGYLSGTDYRYRGPHVGDKHSGMNVKYASDPYWGEKAAARGYYIDTQKQDYGRYTLGIATSGKVQFYKEADGSSTKIYTSEAGDGSGQGAYLYDYPVVILDEVTGSGGQKFYKVRSDMSLQENRNKRDVTAIYKASRDYVYVKASDIKIVFQNKSNITAPDTNVQGKTHGEVLTALNVIGLDGYMTGLAVGSDVSNILTKVRTLDSNIQVVVKKADGSQITSGIVATGMTISITTNSSTVNYTIVIRGDVNGDGKLSAIDYVKLRNYLDGVSSLQGAYLKSTDTSDDGKTSALDYVKLRNHLDNKSIIVQ
ncbi:MAG: glucosaminidase domain-containing protein [Faecalimonas sp.]|nr:glucosaminidase domain-containing protein [Faecalimonas sp.]